MTEPVKPHHLAFTPENTVPTTSEEKKKDAEFNRMVAETLKQSQVLANSKGKGATAKNEHGDTLHISGSETSKSPIVKVHYAFQMGVDYAKKLLGSIDGFKPYANKSWEAFPERINDQKVQYGDGFNDDYSLAGGEKTFVKGEKDGAVDGKEASLAIQQLEWDKTVQTAPDSKNATNNAEKMLQNMIDKNGNLKPEFDVNNNKKLDAEDVEVLAQQVDEFGDGSGKKVLSGDDLDKVTNEYIMDGKKISVPEKVKK